MTIETDTSMAEAISVQDANGSSLKKNDDISTQKANKLASSLFQNADIKTIARTIEQTLKNVLIQIGIAIRSRSRLNTILESIKTRIQFQTDISINISANPSSFFTSEELIVLQQFGLQPEKVLLASQGGLPINLGKTVPNFEALERECIRYKALTSQLAFIVNHARNALQTALPHALEKEAKEQEEQRIKDQLAAAQAAEEQRIKDEQAAKEAEAAAIEAANQAQSAPAPSSSSKEGTNAIVLDDDDDDDDDDVPLAGRNANATNSNDNTAIDLTNESPANKIIPLPSTSGSVPGSEANAEASTTAAANLPIDPATLLAQLTAAVSGSSNMAGIASTINTGTFAPNKDVQSTITTSQPTDTNPLSNFDFSSFGLNNPIGVNSNEKETSDPNTMDNNLFGDLGSSLNMGFDSSTDATNGGGLGDGNLLNFNPEQFEGVDLSFLNNLGGSSAGGSGDGSNDNDSNLLGNIDFSALLRGGNQENT